MKIKHIYVIAALAAIAFSGCKKSSSNQPATPSSSSYFPVTAGSSWVYNDLISGVASTVTITMTGGTSVIDGKTYYGVNLVSSSKGSEAGYYFNSDHEFASRSTHATTNGPITFELQEGNDAQPAGYTWTTSPSDTVPSVACPHGVSTPLKRKT